MSGVWHGAVSKHVCSFQRVYLIQSRSDWSLPDELVFVTVCALLRLASLHPSHRANVMAAIVTFAEESVKMLGEEPAAEVIIHVSPAFHGLYRAVTATPFPWELSEWLACSKAFASLFSVRLVERLNAIVEEFLQRADEDPSLSLYVQAFLARYKANERPLSGYFVICSIVEVQWTALAQVLASPLHDPETQKKKIQSVALTDDAEASNMAWATLMRQKAHSIDSTQQGVKEHLQQTVAHTMKYFNDLLVQVEDMEDDPDNDTYTWETMAESLKLVSLCCVALGDLDSGLLTQIKLMLSDVSPAYDNLLQEGAITSVTVFPEVASPMAHHLRKFITAPLPLLEFHFASDPTAPTVLAAASNCLAVCIEAAPGEDFLLSFIYSLLNYITATNQEMDAGTSPYIHNHANDSTTAVSIESGLRNKTDLEKRRIGMSTISVITRLALAFKREDVRISSHRGKKQTYLALAGYEAMHFTLITASTYPLAAPQNVFSDIIHVFSQINRIVEGAESNSGARTSSNQVLAAQTRLAHELKTRPELYETYLVELLTMFVDKGTAIQTQAGQDKNGTVVRSSNSDGALPLIGSPAYSNLVAHSDFHPDRDASTEVTALFRNMWFICGLFRLSSDDKADMINEWQYAAMTRIAAKTPPVVLEEAQDYLTNSDPSSRQGIRLTTPQVVARHRVTLSKFIPTRGTDIRYLTPTQIIFLLTMHDLENMRAKMFLPSSLVWYFSNEGLNKNAPLTASMDSISEKVRILCVLAGRRIVQHSISPALSVELRKLLVASTHRISKIRELAMKYLQRLISAFPSLLCDPPFVVALLEVLTLIHRACEGEFTDEVSANSTSEGLAIYFPFDKVLSPTRLPLSKGRYNAPALGFWLEAATARAPIEIQATLQNYLADTRVVSADGSAELGATMALQFAKTVPPSDKKQGLDSQPYTLDRARVMATQIASKSYFGGEAGGVRLANRGGKGNHSSIEEIQLPPPTKAPFLEIKALKAKLAVSVAEIRDKTSKLTVQDLRRLLFRCAAVLMALPEPDHDLLHYLVAVPFAAFTPATISTGIDAWTWLIGERKDMEISLMLEFNTAWATTVNSGDPFRHPVGYNPTNKSDMDQILGDARRLLVPHTILLQMLRSRFQAVRYKNPGLMQLLLRLVLRSTRKGVSLSTHALAREPRFSLLIFGFEVLRSSLMDTYPEARLREALYRTALSWFLEILNSASRWSFGANLVQVNADIKLLNEFLEVIQHDNTRADHVTSSLQLEKSTSRHPEYLSKHRSQNSLLKLLIENEIGRLRVWANPTNDLKRGQDYLSNSERSLTDDGWRQMVRTAWNVDAAIATHMSERFKRPIVENELIKLVKSDPSAALHVPEAVKFFIGDRFTRGQKRDYKLLLTWDPVPPVIAIKLFEPRFDNDPITLQYAHRVLAQHPVDVTFFYVPQIVQALRNDAFAEVEDPMKPMLDRMTEMVVASLSGEARNFYEKEFKFFQEVTSISGKLKPYIKKTKPEKKVNWLRSTKRWPKLRSKKDVIFLVTLMAWSLTLTRGQVDHCKVTRRSALDRVLGYEPHIRKVRTETETDPNSVLEGAGAVIQVRKEYDVWQAAIFKVGDDCRQDVLALQIIAMFKNIFTDIGLMLYLYPYRVTATGPGRGVIDVVPNSTSRDEMGRAKINDLMAFFVSKYGTPDTIAFQKARLNFIQSMAAYSVACYILQIKDRHNGNIMIDGEGHIVHIVKFEPNSFKLNHEMIALMGGKNSQGFNLFVQLTVKAFLAIRPHVTQLVDTVSLMLGADFPSFKGEPTIKRLQDRFVPQMTERQAADWMMGVIRNAQENVRSTFYDEFQRVSEFRILLVLCQTNLRIIRVSLC
ncbi:phosphatidylinositol 4-kinase beta [Rhizoctonia solani AG-1 IA]|uniref:1-phosphatidylinositol 4-kinase n=1 Tax=Thanatephorus cucumeris (strain AG1-IA) TaxID=983506 RepID=L8X3B7_THACA|nr:phosphatidylinositol 4-kinase beta [Rhizoctonia solani AG-1 IA]